MSHRRKRRGIRGTDPSPAFRAAACLVLSLACALAAGCAGARRPPPRPFADRPIAWHEHDDEHLDRPPRATELAELDLTLILRDGLASEVDHYLALEGDRPALDVNALDEVPCSTWFCPRNHLAPMPPPAVAAGPPGDPPELPLRIVKGKTKGATPGFEVKDARDRRYVLKFDPPGHIGISTGAEMVGGRLLHAAGYNVPPSFLVDLGPTDLQIDQAATFDLYGVQERPLTPEIVERQLERAGRGPDGRIRASTVAWLPGKILGAFDMTGRRPDDPNDRIRHERRRSLRASWMLVAWLGIFDMSAINTLDSYVEENGRRFVRHYLIDFGAGLGSSTVQPKSPNQGQEHLIEVGRTLSAFGGLGFYRRPYADLRRDWRRTTAAHPAVGWYQAEGFDPEDFRTNRKVPSHRRMTARDAYWGAKVVTAFSDAQLAAVAAEAGLPPADEQYLAHALRTRRDIIGRRYLRAVTAVEAPALSADGRALCFTDLAIARGYADGRQVRYWVSVSFGGAPAARVPSAHPATGDRTCVPLEVAPSSVTYTAVQLTAEYLPANPKGGEPRRARSARVHLTRERLVGLERDE